jgi:hypothetical protein
MAEKVYKQERPSWCPHKDCLFKRRTMDNACAGNLPQPVPHNGDFDYYRLCLNGVLPNEEVFDLQVNNTDLEWLRWLFDSLDGKQTSWLSKK